MEWREDRGPSFTSFSIFCKSIIWGGFQEGWSRTLVELHKLVLTSMKIFQKPRQVCKVEWNVVPAVGGCHRVPLMPYWGHAPVRLCSNFVEAPVTETDRFFTSPEVCKRNLLFQGAIFRFHFLNFGSVQWDDQICWGPTAERAQEVRVQLGWRDVPVFKEIGFGEDWSGFQDIKFRRTHFDGFLHHFWWLSKTLVLTMLHSLQMSEGQGNDRVDGQKSGCN